MESSKSDFSLSITHALTLKKTQVWRYETDELEGVCEIAHDKMVVKCTLATTSNKFFDVLEIDRLIRRLLESPVSVERLAEQLSDCFPDYSVVVAGRAKTHGWITSTVPARWV